MKKITSRLASVILLTCLFSPQLFAYANTNTFVSTLSPSPHFSIKNSEATDPVMRRGTENWEQSQSDFFIVPGVILGLFALVLFWKRD
ncbi:hypothetical protein [Crenothrix polyspora]|uniref:Uncharacterized protein n=1 Tax=Crenothrix polyspora TaxID=360316 RepID=A0A1R4HG97_9GAMM|nr:hypothetical protein [Crenothrix polyspora]SJM95237.1 conserved exported hypothetical protein [Crenothrix polyspora]